MSKNSFAELFWSSLGDKKAFYSHSHYFFFPFFADEYSRNITVSVILKMAPLWVSKLICKTPISRWVNKLWHGGKEKSTLAIIQELTDNKDLQTVFSYCWGDYGTVPAKSHFGMHSVLLQHYQFGAFYPVGGASEIAYNVIPVIER